MAVFEINGNGGGSKTAIGYVENITSGQSITISGLGFKPTAIMAVTTGNGNSNGAFAFLFDKDFSVSQQRYCGQGQFTWRSYSYPAGTSSGFDDVNSDGFVFHQNTSYGASRLDYIAIG